MGHSSFDTRGTVHGGQDCEDCILFAHTCHLSHKNFAFCCSQYWLGKKWAQIFTFGSWSCLVHIQLKHVKLEVLLMAEHLGANACLFTGVGDEPGRFFCLWSNLSTAKLTVLSARLTDRHNHWTSRYTRQVPGIPPSPLYPAGAVGC